MNQVTSKQVREFLLARFAEQFKGMGTDPATVPDSFDFLLAGATDSLGVLDMVMALEKEYGMEIDLGALGAEQMTVLGPLSEYVAAYVRKQSELKV